MNTLSHCRPSHKLGHPLKAFTTGVLALAMFTTALPNLALAQNGPALAPLAQPAADSSSSGHASSPLHPTPNSPIPGNVIRGNQPLPTGAVTIRGQAPAASSGPTPAPAPVAAPAPAVARGPNLSPAPASAVVAPAVSRPASPALSHPQVTGIRNSAPLTSSSARFSPNPPQPILVRGGPPGRGPAIGRGPAPSYARPDVRVVIEDPHAGPRFYAGPGRDEFRFVRPAPAPRFIESHDLLRDLLLRPLAESVVWGIGDIATIELANALGLPVNTPVYAVQAGVPVYSTLPPGYFVAESLPQNVALVTYGPAGEVILSRRVPPGAFVAYQTSPGGVVLSECVVVPPVQQIIVPTVTQVVVAPAPVVVNPAPVVAPTPAPEPPSTSSIPMSSTKSGKIVYDSNGKPVGVIIQEGDGQQEFVPIQ